MNFTFIKAFFEHDVFIFTPVWFCFHFATLLLSLFRSVLSNFRAGRLLGLWFPAWHIGPSPPLLALSPHCRYFCCVCVLVLPPDLKPYHTHPKQIHTAKTPSVIQRQKQVFCLFLFYRRFSLESCSVAIYYTRSICFVLCFKKECCNAESNKTKENMLKNRSNVCVTFITKPTRSDESIKVENLYCSQSFVPPSLLNKLQSQQMQDMTRGVCQLQARHQNQGTSSRRGEVQQKCFIVPKWLFFKLLRGAKTQTELMEGNVVARRNQINEWTVSSSTYCLTHQSPRQWRGSSESPSEIVFIGLWRYWKEDWNVWQHV